MGRCFVIAVDESKAQTLKIIDYQNKKAAGHHSPVEEQQATTFLQTCVRCLQPYEVINPYADKVKLPEEAHKLRRLNELYQSYVKQITLLHQYRRKRNDHNQLVTEKEDLQQAAQIMFESIVLKVDELDGGLRHFYERLKAYVKSKGDGHENYTFMQREIRQSLHISRSLVQRYLYQLQRLEYIHPISGHKNRGFYYKIDYWDDIGKLKARVKRHLQGQLDQLDLL